MQLLGGFAAEFDPICLPAFGNRTRDLGVRWIGIQIERRRTQACQFARPQPGFGDLRGDEFESENDDDRIAELGQMVVAAFVRYLAEPSPEESGNSATGSIERLVNLARERGSEIDLDGRVHEAASALAAGVNNGGVGEQIRFLCEQWGVGEVEGILRQD